LSSKVKSTLTTNKIKGFIR